MPEALVALAIDSGLLNMTIDGSPSAVCTVIPRSSPPICSCHFCCCFLYIRRRAHRYTDIATSPAPATDAPKPIPTILPVLRPGGIMSEFSVSLVLGTGRAPANALEAEMLLLVEPAVEAKDVEVAVGRPVDTTRVSLLLVVLVLVSTDCEICGVSAEAIEVVGVEDGVDDEVMASGGVSTVRDNDDVVTEEDDSVVEIGGDCCVEGGDPPPTKEEEEVQSSGLDACGCGTAAASSSNLAAG
ncbi:hypothetical protein M406DRAFT_332555 [Cryphonectria parasitica EP155]|uniref:Uncharacterized protein n=1 Tax=Cryphonectria parasitica (strain ATCC 38755 / EP155) TaxID=660469 RepID=A0A9P5CKK5_CRYP1|nr:uncharacterized protein M406DRAFT_332555 [Cryphonectria parasitica EP155]KAF3762168.1 hypothetical protein M406DRAFT_332555 [Cryphonectria parasitica EP155]